MVARKIWPISQQHGTVLCMDSEPTINSSPGETASDPIAADPIVDPPHAGADPIVDPHAGADPIVLMYVRKSCPNCAKQMTEIGLASLTAAQRLRLLVVEIGAFQLSTEELAASGVTGVPTSILLSSSAPTHGKTGLTVLQTNTGVLDGPALARWLSGHGS